MVISHFNVCAYSFRPGAVGELIQHGPCAGRDWEFSYQSSPSNDLKMYTCHFLSTHSALHFHKSVRMSPKQIDRMKWYNYEQHYTNSNAIEISTEVTGCSPWRFCSGLHHVAQGPFHRWSLVLPWADPSYQFQAWRRCNHIEERDRWLRDVMKAWYLAILKERGLWTSFICYRLQLGWFYFVLNSHMMP